MIDELITNTLKRYINDHPDNYYVIGGNALNYVLDEYGINFRVTHDFDIVLVTEVKDESFSNDLVRLLTDGHYKNKWRNEKKTAYRFEDTDMKGYPKSIEFFVEEGKYPESFDKRLAKLDIKVNEDKISAITLDKDLYRFALSHRKTIEGLTFLDREALLVLKIIAYFNNEILYKDGHKVDKNDYLKHRKDVITILSSYNEQSFAKIEFPEQYHDMIVTFIEVLTGKDVNPIYKKLNLDKEIVVDFYKRLFSL